MTLPYHGVEPKELRNPELRNGLRIVGDSFPFPGATYAVGTYARCRCTVQGVIGAIWTATLNYVAEIGANAYSPAAHVMPSTTPTLPDGSTRTWHWTSGPGNLGAGHEPAWPASGNFTDADGNAWVDDGVGPTFRPSDLIDDDVQIAVRAMADADQTLSVGTTRPVIQTTGAITADRTLTLPSTLKAGTVRHLDNQCTGAHFIKIAPATGDLNATGIANGMSAGMYFDGTDWRRLTPDATP